MLRSSRGRSVWHSTASLSASSRLLLCLESSESLLHDSGLGNSETQPVLRILMPVKLPGLQTTLLRSMQSGSSGLQSRTRLRPYMHRWSQGPWDPPHGKADATSEPGHLWWNACPEQPGWTLPWWLWEDEGLGRALQGPFECWVPMGWGCTSWCSSSWRSSSVYHKWDGH